MATEPMMVGSPAGRSGCMCGCTPWWAVEAAADSQRGKGPAAQRTNDQVNGSVEAVLTNDPWLDASAIQVSVQDGVVTLTGQVATRADKRRAEDLTDRVWGVRDVQNHLQVAGVQPPTTA